uniref:Uncharacterized protein n=1 Tax=Seriola lalandi dorsalis TaxID=1841481 RepID=A0A3B4WRL1_SERLL
YIFAVTMDILLSTFNQFLCSICLDVFTDPVTTPCGHNFCKNCITTHWDISDRCQCPMCKKVFKRRPELHINTLFSEVVAQFKHEAQQKTNRMCTKHDKPLELFCQTDQTCVCMLCSVLDHKTHEFVPLKEGYEGKKAELEKTEAEIQQMIQKRRLIKEIQDKQKTTDKQAEDFITELEQEISELMKRSTEVEQLSLSEDHLHLLQSFPSLKAAPPTKDWTEVRVRPSYEGTVVRAVAQLEETLSEEMKKLIEAELKRVQQYAEDVTLDPDTAHPNLILSKDGKKVHCGDVRKFLPDNKERFSVGHCVLAKQSFSSGRFYFEVQVKGKTDWKLGVARESINRKGKITLRPEYGYWMIFLRNGNEYKALASPPVRLSLKSQPEKVGVFVDYEEGLVSFYDVAAAALIYSFTGCSFTKKLFPYFNPRLNYGGKNSAPVTICPVSSTW